MSSNRRKKLTTRLYADFPQPKKSNSKKFKQIPSLNPTGNSLPVTNNKRTKKVARLLVALLIIVIIISIVCIAKFS